MTKVVYNSCYGGFSLSTAAIKRYAELSGKSEISLLSGRDIPRADPLLVQVVEELGEKANGSYAFLQIEEVEPGTLYRIDEYDGAESVMLQSDYEWSVA